MGTRVLASVICILAAGCGADVRLVSDSAEVKFPAVIPEGSDPVVVKIGNLGGAVSGALQVSLYGDDAASFHVVGETCTLRQLRVTTRAAGCPPLIPQPGL